MTFQARLRRVLRDGNLTVADLARWFGRKDATVRAWVNSGYGPRGGYRDQVYIQDRLNELERKIFKNEKSIPPGLDRKGRRQFMSNW